MLRRLKLAFLRTADALGLNSMLLESRWRRNRLLILCYHGVSLEDEHQWGPAMYLPPALFRQRMEALRRMDCAVLPLGEALERLYSGTLPARAVAITFDDGAYDFYKAAYPVLREHGLPATLYFTTYYSSYNRPVFGVMLNYLLWKGRETLLTWPEFLPEPVWLDERRRREVQTRVVAQVRQARLRVAEKDAVLAQLASRLKLDYEALCAKRILTLMTPDQAAELAAAGVDIQLHTHRHRVSLRRDLFLKEIEDNRRAISVVSPRPAVHFCYPSGLHRPEFPEFLRSAGVESATTSDPGLAGRHTSPYLLPRMLDVATLTGTEFTAWLSGLASFLPHRPHPADRRPALEDPPEAGGPRL